MSSEKRELASSFLPGDIEGPLYTKWIEAGYFTADANSSKEPFTIVIPPPNVTGNLHIGHALDQTLQDCLTRMKRMQGFEALWLPGMDHAGIATQNVVEKQLATQGLSRHDLGREDFVKKVWEWKSESGGQILGQMRRLGDSVDWSREAFTMDENLSQAVLTIFKKLFDQGLIYRAERIINWCPRCLTALSDIEVEHQDDEGEFVQVRYGEGEQSIVVATTRAETMMGDGAVAVHPDDPRYKHMVGTEVLLPLVNRMIPIIADELVDPDFGTGAVKVTAAHDPNDFEMAMRHNVPFVVIMNEHGIMDGTGTEFDGMDRFDARVAVVAKLKEMGRIVAEKRPYIHAVGHCSRCDTTVEPRLSKQWFVKVAPLAKAAGDAVRDGRVKIEPAELAPRYFEWVDNMHDWCISRQLWWGHRIPVWYGPNDEVIVVGPGESAPAGYTQDPDVLDTWFSSALWPFSTLGWPNNTADVKKFYPTSVLVTGYDILFFWVARMMLFGLFAMDGVPPFHTIVLHGLVRDQFGKKMSKSRGNVVDPLEFIDKYGADALRFTLARGSNPGKDQALAEDWIAGSRNFATKLWNATRFAMMNGATVEGPLPATETLSDIDKWVLSRLSETTTEFTALMESYEFARACDAIYHFAWDDLCDWYLELSKEAFASGNAGASQRVLGHVLDTLFRLLHPVMPFITETLWTTLTGGETLVTAKWPVADSSHINKKSEALVGELQKIITEVRRFRNDQGVKPSQKIPGRFIAPADVTAYASAMAFLLRLELTEFTPSASVEIGSMKVELDLSGTVDVVAERARLEKDLVTAQKDMKTADVKLNNEGFMAKAPESVVAEIRERMAATSADIERITAQLAALK
ncbi:valyl-tRNA synthetase [Candidatus Planktophila dulcis]|uniref:Valine--tRNA ligase n=1 Tax=Candidatus Planktophila dulcis TaxID=1884914 RepID=A0AAD0E620_9ACTN|nr:valine--tRNA ligase [Candidatus Planktophila dulcis]ASY12260.1 valyl-tRNA synthetase [Candidatus Planktophila dulcis]ASY21508.1 valyl-tRNA synthetase [Candidatus Planktophila dulcis]